MRYIALVLLVAVLAGCGSGGTTQSSAARSPSANAVGSPSAAALTSAQAVSICQDLKSWLATAMNQDMPRFSAQLKSDETEANNANSQLGADLTGLDEALQESNSLALNPLSNVTGGLPSPSYGQFLAYDCSQVGVTVPFEGPAENPANY